MRKPGNVIIIGASSGLGRESAVIFGRSGWKVGAIARRQDLLQSLREEVPGVVATASADVTDDGFVKVLNDMISGFGKVDIIFLTAGIGWNNPGLDIGKDLLTVRTNVEGFVRTVDTAYAYFRDHNPEGQIAAVSSVAGIKGIGISACYSASKSFDSTYLEALSQLARVDKTGITVTDIKPGFVRTALLDPDRAYPLLMTPEEAARQIVRAVIKRKSVAVVNRKWSLVVWLWRALPHFIWRKLKIRF